MESKKSVFFTGLEGDLMRQNEQSAEHTARPQLRLVGCFPFHSILAPPSGWLDVNQ